MLLIFLFITFLKFKNGKYIVFVEAFKLFCQSNMEILSRNPKMNF